MTRRRLADCFSAAEPCQDLSYSTTIVPILDAIRLQSLSIKTSAHWELGAEHAFSAAAGFSALRLAAYLFVQVMSAWKVHGPG